MDPEASAAARLGVKRISSRDDSPASAADDPVTAGDVGQGEVRNGCPRVVVR